ncbi:hypothetical protein ACFYU9_05665 [Streptomyces sp. NPDC004327]|uniref:hypothetical protein n=1 Tax=Streptomyces sp. NPDC004327 TaxID=3364699 RepID=UPI00368E0943
MPDLPSSIDTEPESLLAPVTASELITLADVYQGVTVTVLPYPTMEAGDVVTLFWGGQEAAAHVVADAAGRSIEIKVPAPVITAVGTGEVLVTYEVRRAENRLASPPLAIRVDTTTQGPDGVAPDFSVSDSPVNL